MAPPVVFKGRWEASVMTSDRDNGTLQGQSFDEIGESVGLLEDQNNPSYSQTETRPCPHRARTEGLRGRHLCAWWWQSPTLMFVAVTDPEKRAQIATLYRDVFDAYIAPAVEAARDSGYPEAKRKTCEPRCTWLRISMKRPCTYLSRAGPAEVRLKVRRFFLPFRMCCSLVERWSLGASLTTAHRSH